MHQVPHLQSMVRVHDVLHEICKDHCAQLQDTHWSSLDMPTHEKSSTVTMRTWQQPDCFKLYFSEPW